jgi:hypothetical protein|tara:strand:+ start:1443 stop:1613 length:171 start_codon:yes stop_codon:yes gene_type:complete
MNVDLFFDVVIKLLCLYVGIQIINGVLLLSNGVMQSLSPPPLAPASKGKKPPKTEE